MVTSFLCIQLLEVNKMKIIKLEFDFLVGPIVKEVFSTSKNELVTGIEVIDNDSELGELNEKACSLYSSCYEFDKNDACSFNFELAKTHKNELSNLMNMIVDRLNSINDGSFEIKDFTKDQLDSLK